MISCVLLAAGLSRRFGSPKALARIADKTVFELLQDRLVKSDVQEIVVVLGAHAKGIEPLLLDHFKIKSVYNKDYLLGQTSSFKTGVQSTSLFSKGIMLLPVDCPFIKTETINFLIKEFEKKQPRILIPVYQNRRGHPPIFSSKLKDQILAIDNTVGLNVFEHEHPAEVMQVDVNDDGVLKTFNTPQEFERLIG